MKVLHYSIRSESYIYSSNEFESGKERDAHFLKVCKSNIKNKVKKAKNRFRKASPRIIDESIIEYNGLLKEAVCLTGRIPRPRKVLDVDNMCYIHISLSKCGYKLSDSLLFAIFDSDGQNSYTIIDFSEKMIVRCTEEDLINSNFNVYAVLFKQSHKNNEANLNWLKN